MADEKKYTVEEAQRFLAVDAFNKVWGLLEGEDRTEQDDESSPATSAVATGTV